MASSRPQCEAITKRGERCANRAQAGSPFCGVHRGYPTDVSQGEQPSTLASPPEPGAAPGRLGARGSAWIAIGLFCVALVATLAVGEPGSRLGRQAELFVGLPAGIASLVFGFRAFRRRVELPRARLAVTALVCGWVGLMLPTAAYLVAVNERAESVVCEEQDREWLAAVEPARASAYRATRDFTNRFQQEFDNRGRYVGADPAAFLSASRGDLETVVRLGEAATPQPCSDVLLTARTFLISAGSEARRAAESTPDAITPGAELTRWLTAIRDLDEVLAELQKYAAEMGSGRSS